MGNGWYKKGAQFVLNKGADFDTDTFRVYALDLGAYTPNFNTDEFLDVIPGGALIGNGTLASLSIADGVFNAADLTFACSATSVEAFVLVWWTGSAATSRLLLYWNTATGMPFTTGGNVTFKWSTAGEIFHLPIAS